MHYKIFGDTLPAVTITCDAGETLYAQAGGMTWMTDAFEMDTTIIAISFIPFGNKNDLPFLKRLNDYV